MGRKRNNTFSKALGHLKSNQIDEKLEVLSEIPINNTLGIYSIVPGTLTEPSSQPTDVPDQSTIDWTIDGSDGKDTSGIFDSEGNSKMIGPPITEASPDDSYIQGPMASMYYTWASPTVWTMIGYIRESDRRFVNLGYVYMKQLDDWDGDGADYVSYGQLTLEQAQWFRETYKKDGPSRDGHFRAFYPGPPSNSADGFNRYFCQITGTAKATKQQFNNVAAMGLQAADNFSAQLSAQLGGRLTSGVQNLWNFAKNWTDTGGLQGLTAGIVNRGSKVLGDFLLGQAERSPWMVKGLKGTSFDTFNFNKKAFTSFKGSGPKPNVGNWFDRQFGKVFKGRKLADFADDVVKGTLNPNLNFDPKFFQKLAGKNYVGQYFTDGTKFKQALDYAKGGVVVATERLDSAAGWKNWFGGQFSRSVKGEPEIFVRGADLAKNKVFKVFDAADTKSVAKLKDLVTKGAKNSKWLGRAGRAVPFVGAVASGYDAYDRFQKGDTFGGVLSVASMMPGPVGWWALGAQVAYDVEGAVNKDGFKGTVTGSRWNEGYIMEGVNSDTQVIPDIGKQGMYDGLLEKGVPLNDPEAYAQQMAAVMVESGMNPELIHIIISAVRRKDFSPEDVEGMKASMMGLAMNLVAHRRKMEAGQDGTEFHPNNPLSTEDDPWALGKQQTQESLELSEHRKSRIMRTLKEPVVLPETKQKSYKVRPGRRGKTNYRGMDKLVGDIKPSTPFKTKRDAWSKDWQGYNAKSSQDKKNQVLEKIGDGQQAFDYMLTDSKKKSSEELAQYWGLHPELYSYNFGGKKYKPLRKEEVKGDYIVFMEDENGKRSSILQSELNLKLSEAHEQQLLDEYNQLQSEKDPVPFFKDPLMKKVAKRLKNEIEYEGKPAVKGYPNEPPPEMVKGFHPKYGKNYKYDKLDPVSAVVMRNAPTGDKDIDTNVDKAARKPKIKVKEEKSNWRDEIG